MYQQVNSVKGCVTSIRQAPIRLSNYPWIENPTVVPIIDALKRVEIGIAAPDLCRHEDQFCQVLQLSPT